MQQATFSIQFFYICIINMSEKTLIVLLGPTGVGKTDLSLRIAEQLPLKNSCNGSNITSSGLWNYKTIIALHAMKKML